MVRARPEDQAAPAFCSSSEQANTGNAPMVTTAANERKPKARARRSCRSIQRHHVVLRFIRQLV
jgi:hypothetical protein